MPSLVSSPVYTKEQAGYVQHYVPVDDGNKRCGTCAFFTEGTCDLVIGLIEPYGGCEFYQPATYLKDVTPFLV